MNESATPHQYGRHTGEPRQEDLGRPSRELAREARPYGGETYYDLPAVKPSPWGWLIASYFFLGGLAGAAQLLAAIANLAGGPGQRPVVRLGRYLGFAGTLISPVLLILDLHMPTRWYAMLRIVRTTSPMSIGSWILSAFGALSTLTALCQLAIDRGQVRWTGLGRTAGLLAGLAGAGMATYTATLLSATSIPLWLTAHRTLPTLFGATSMTSAIAAIQLILDLRGDRSVERRPLRLLGLLAALVQLTSLELTHRVWHARGVDGPIIEPRLQTVNRVLVLGCGGWLPLLRNLLPSALGSPWTSILASLATLLGCFAERWLLVFAGNASATRARDYFQITQAEATHGTNPGTAGGTPAVPGLTGADPSSGTPHA